MYSHKTPFADGNLLVSASSKHRGGLLTHYCADLIVCLTTMRVLKDRHEAETTMPHRVLIRLYEAIEAGEKVLVLT